MGYICTRDAKNTLGVIGQFYATDGNPNILTIGKEYASINAIHRQQRQMQNSATQKRTTVRN